MAQPLNVSASRSIPVPVEAAYDAVLPMPLPRIFNRRFAALPPIREVRDQEGVWGTVGQTRTIVLADGGTMHETLGVGHAGDRLRLPHRAARAACSSRSCATSRAGGASGPQGPASR